MYDFIIVGQGIAGTLLSYELTKRNCKILVFDDADSANSSLVAGAVINPVNVNKGHVVHDAKTIMHQAKKTYQEIEKFLGIDCFSEKKLYVIKPNFVADKNSFVSDTNAEEKAALSQCFFNYENALSVSTVACIQVNPLLKAWRDNLKKSDAYLNERVALHQLEFQKDYVQYGKYKAKAIIFCDGAAARQNLLLQEIPFTKNRGEGLMLEIPLLSQLSIYHVDGLRLVPFGENKFWCGSNYEWDFEDLKPNVKWRSKTEKKLRDNLKVPFFVKQHIVGERPTTSGQQVFAGFSKHQPRLAFLNGLGTRGFSLAPQHATILAKTLIRWLEKDIGSHQKTGD